MLIQTTYSLSAWFGMHYHWSWWTRLICSYSVVASFLCALRILGVWLCLHMGLFRILIGNSPGQLDSFSSQQYALVNVSKLIKLHLINHLVMMMLHPQNCSWYNHTLGQYICKYLNRNDILTLAVSSCWDSAPCWYDEVIPCGYNGKNMVSDST